MKNMEWKILIPLTLFLVIANFTGFLQGVAALKWFSDNAINIVIALAISILYFIIKIFDKKVQIEQLIHLKLEESASGLQKVITASLKAPFVSTFSDESEFKNYYAKRISQATKCIDDLTWSHKISEKQHVKTVRTQERALEREIDRAAGNIVFREIFMFNVASRKDKLKRRLLENKGGYNCSYYESPNPLPRLQYVLIDNCEAIFTSSAFGDKFSVINPTIVNLLKTYFEVAWRDSLPLKIGFEWHINNIEGVLLCEINDLMKDAQHKDLIISV